RGYLEVVRDDSGQRLVPLGDRPRVVGLDLGRAPDRQAGGGVTLCVAVEFEQIRGCGSTTDRGQAVPERPGNAGGKASATTRPVWSSKMCAIRTTSDPTGGRWMRSARTSMSRTSAGTERWFTDTATSYPAPRRSAAPPLSGADGRVRRPAHRRKPD